MSKVLGVLLALLTVPLFLGVVGFSVAWLDSGSASVKHTTTIPVGPAPRVSLFLGAGGTTGSVTVRRGASGSVVVQERDTVRSWTHASAAPALESLRASIRGGYGLGVVIEADNEPRSAQDAFGGPLRSDRDISVQVPPGSDVRIEGGALIDLIDLNGPVQATTYLGVIHLQDLTLTGRSSLIVSRAGGIAGTITMAGGSLNATAGTGGMQIALTSAGGTHLHAESANGSIETPGSYGLTRQRFLSGYSVDGVIAGSGPGGQLSLSTTNGVIKLT